MAKCHRSNVGSLFLDRPASTFRRFILDAVSCGSASFRHRHHPTAEDHDASSTTTITTTSSIIQVPETAAFQPKTKAKDGSSATKTEKLADLLNLRELLDKKDENSDGKKKEELKWVVQELQTVEEEKGKAVAAASSVRKLAKEDAEARTVLAMLGVIPPLVGMLDTEDHDTQIASLYALLNLGIGNDANKAAIVKAGAIHKMLKLTEFQNPPNSAVSEAIVANFLGLSALDSNKPVIGSSGAIPFLVKTLKNLENKSGSSQARQDALRALYNLTILQQNIAFIVETVLIPYLLTILGDMEFSERILSILGNVVSTPEGRKTISVSPDAFPVLVDVLNWNDSPGCQEKASYILMVMAHKAYGDRQAMIDAGIMSSLLELTLLGSTLAQKRASRILECLRVDKGKQVSGNYCGNVGGNVSAPVRASSSSSANPNGAPKEGLEDDDGKTGEENMAVKQLVQQSLQNNMRRIVKRANLPQDFVPSEHFKSLTSSSTSKSLPF